MSARLWPLATLILGLATLAVFIALGAQDAVRGVYSQAEVGVAVSAFQRAETPVDIAAVFGDPADPARVAAMDAINTLDLWGFIPAYMLFLSAAAIMVGGLRDRWSWAAIAFALVGGGADAIETWTQLRLTANLADPAANLPIAPWHWLKYAALALHGVAIATLCILSTPKRWIIFVLALASLPLVAGAYVELLSPRLFSASFAAYWIALLILAAMQTVRAKGSPA